MLIMLMMFLFLLLLMLMLKYALLLFVLQEECMELRANKSGRCIGVDFSGGTRRSNMMMMNLSRSRMKHHWKRLRSEDGGTRRVKGKSRRRRTIRRGSRAIRIRKEGRKGRGSERMRGKRRKRMRCRSRGGLLQSRIVGGG